MVLKIRPRETICGCQSCTTALIVTGGVRVDDVAAVSDDAFASGHVANPHRPLCGRHSRHAVTKHVRYSAGCYALHPGCFLTLRNAPKMRVGAPRWLESRTQKSLANTTSTQPQGTERFFLRGVADARPEGEDRQAPDTVFCTCFTKGSYGERFTWAHQEQQGSRQQFFRTMRPKHP